MHSVDNKILSIHIGCTYKFHHRHYTHTHSHIYLSIHSILIICAFKQPYGVQFKCIRVWFGIFSVIGSSNKPKTYLTLTICSAIARICSVCGCVVFVLSSWCRSVRVLWVAKSMWRVVLQRGVSSRCASRRERFGWVGGVVGWWWCACVCAGKLYIAQWGCWDSLDL